MNFLHGLWKKRGGVMTVMCSMDGWRILLQDRTEIQFALNLNIKITILIN